MKRSTRVAGIAVLLMVGLTAFEAFGEGAVLCTVNVTATASDALAPSSDGGTTCAWQRKSVLGLQCPQAEVCFDPTAQDRTADGGRAGASVSATTGSTCANFITGQGSPDPFLINLGPNEHNISLIAAQIADGGSTVACKFVKTLRVQP